MSELTPASFDHWSTKVVVVNGAPLTSLGMVMFTFSG
jgi:hypothetical protein